MVGAWQVSTKLTASGNPFEERMPFDYKDALSIRRPQWIALDYFAAWSCCLS
jgi:hypothetical protein